MLFIHVGDANDTELDRSSKYLIDLHAIRFIKIASENPVLWTGMKDAAAESRKNKSDAETSSA